MRLLSAIRTAIQSRGGTSPPPPTPPRAGGGARALAPPPDIDDLDDPSWPDDPHEVPSWRIGLEARARQRGFTPVGYRTRAEYEAAVACCRRALEGEDEITTLAPTEAARRFVAELRLRRPETRLDDAEMRSCYADHCRRHRLTELPQNVLRPAMLRMSGVARTQINIQRGRHGQRYRPTVWIISQPRRKADATSEMRAAA